MSKHTPGPWRLIHGDAVIEIASVKPESSFAFVRNANSSLAKRADANARLIAAAPEMLELIKELQTKLSSEFHYAYKPKIDAIIAKAEQS